MMNSPLLSPSGQLSNCHTYDSSRYPGVSFSIRRMTLRQRIALIGELSQLYRERDFHAAGHSQLDRLNAQLNALRIDEVFLKWGVLAVRGLVIDDHTISPEDLCERAPEDLTAEILGRIRECISITADQEKN